jgi:uncharacterized protein YggE
MRTTVNLDDDVYQAATSLARSSGRSLGKVLSQIARKGLQPEPMKRKKGGLPTFTVSKNAPMVPGDRIQKFWDEEGL